jgi:DNA polymerase/3'-5' exonuclease PolX
VNGRIIAIHSAEDLTAAMVGYPIAGITGYTPATAVQIIRNIVIWSDAEKK